VAAHCHPNPPSYAQWKPKFKSKLPKGWPRKEQGKNWTEEETERVLDALTELPPALTSQDIIGIFRAIKSLDYPNPASSINKSIVLYNTIFSESYSLARVLAHELSHEVFRRLTKSERREYFTATNWIPLDHDDNPSVWARREEGFVEEDGKSSPEEDFANNMEYFLFDREKLKKATPNSYSWFQKRFGEKLKLKGESKHEK
jgi:hypothetical protein